MVTVKWILFFALAALVGCATVPFATPASDAEAKGFLPPEGKANLYIARNGSDSGGAFSFKVVVDGKALGEIGPGILAKESLDNPRHQEDVRVLREVKKLRGKSS